MRYAGVVQEGSKRGKALGYPTINIPLSYMKVSGVYAAQVFLNDETRYMAAAFADPTREVLEAHIIDFSRDLYGATVEIELLKKIRDTVKLDDDEALQRTISEDIAKVREYFKKML